MNSQNGLELLRLVLIGSLCFKDTSSEECYLNNYLVDNFCDDHNLQRKK